MQRRVEVDPVVIIAVQQIAEVIDFHGEIVAAREGDELAEQVRVAEDEVGCLEGAEAATVDDGAAILIFAAISGSTSCRI